MSITEIIAMCERKITNLHSVRGAAVALGDMAQVERLDVEINETQATLNQLRTLPE